LSSNRENFRRHANTDWLRALAIVLVLVHHLGQKFHTLPSLALNYLKLGVHGVDLFFVLSGWLIGGLYWQEKLHFGSVQIGRFWARRWLRTLPVYFAVLPVAYLSVYLFRQQEFDWAYMVFGQNYRGEIPFFLVSWSLAVEEHFYLILPLLLGLLGHLRVPGLYAVGGLVVIFSCMRVLDSGATSDAPFGYSMTASHFHFTGLFLGVFLAKLKYGYSTYWARFLPYCNILVVGSLGAFFTLPLWSAEAQYYWGNNVAIFAAASLLLLAQYREQLWCASTKLVKRVALTSYSVYLTHAMVINAVLLLCDGFAIEFFAMVPLTIIVIFLVGEALYIFVEKPSMQLRERLVKRRN